MIMLSKLKWLQTDLKVRQRLCVDFAVPQSEATFVANNEVISDGHTDRDLQVITVEKLQAYTAMNEVDFYKLYDAAVELAAKTVRKDELKLERKLHKITV